MTPPFILFGKTSFTQMEDDQYRNSKPKGDQVLSEKPGEKDMIFGSSNRTENSLVNQKVIFFGVDSHPPFDRQNLGATGNSVGRIHK